MTDPVVIVGGGQAGVQLCLALRKNKFDGPVVMYSAETPLPYHRPPLSKAFLVGKIAEDKLPMRPDSFYSSKGIDLRLGDSVNSIDLANKTVNSASGKQAYSHLVLATGARPRSLPIDGIDAKGVHQLRNLADSKAIKSALLGDEVKSVVVVGAGFIGLEVAAAARGLGKQVTVFDTADRVMARAVAPAISDWFRKMHESTGVKIRLGEAISSVGNSGGRVSHVNCENGDRLDAQMVIVGIGVIPEVEIAESAGLACDNGIVVDQYCRTSDPSVFAAGDCASHPNQYAGGRQLRLESIQNATDQARTIAVNISSNIAKGITTGIASNQAGGPVAYEVVPWFWSDQGDHSLQMTGLSIEADQYVLRGEPASDSFSIYHFRENKLIAVDSVNMPRDHMLARKLIGNRVSPTAAQAADIQFDLKSIV